jgi:hypothetical protein
LWVFRAFDDSRTCPASSGASICELHLEIVVNPLPGETHLARNVGYVHLFGGQIMDLVISFHTLLMALLALLPPFVCFGLYAKEGRIRLPLHWRRRLPGSALLL